MLLHTVFQPACNWRLIDCILILVQQLHLGLVGTLMFLDKHASVSRDARINQSLRILRFKETGESEVMIIMTATCSLRMDIGKKNRVK